MIKSYLFPLRLPTTTLTGVAVALLMPAPVGVAVAVNATTPRLEGLQLQVTEKVEPDPAAALFLHPGRTLPLTLNVTLEATLMLAVTTTAVR